MRVLLVIVLVLGLVPPLGEAVEMAVHFATTGHLAHFQAGEKDLDAGNREHGCGTVAHHCSCCVSQSMLPSGTAQTVLLPIQTGEPIRGAELKVATGMPQRLLRPPIAA
ncbi:hypothetical protein JGU66_13200 [Myxococcaceae bacterium JPH2]|nr:hypothetical protein [Myxococcaceae bacterium JPH2]